MTCQVLQENSSVLRRRGFALPEISITPQDFDEEISPVSQMSAPKTLKDFLQCLGTPKTACLESVYACLLEKQQQQQQQHLGSSPCPRFFAEEDFASYFSDIQQELSTPNFISDIVRNYFSPGLNKVNIFTPLNFHNTDIFYNNYDFNSDKVELVLPKTKDLITTNTPVVVKRLLGNQDEFDMYFPQSSYTPCLNNQGKSSEIFVFPDCKENPEFFNTTSYQSTENHFDLLIQNNTIRRKRQNDANHYAPYSTKFKLKKSQNEMERQRRVDQYIRFQTLRQSIPNISENQKAAKITILQAALSYMKQLNEEEAILQNIKKTEQKKNHMLLQKVRQLSGLKTNIIPT